jgi:hypothetical protein
MAHKSQVLWSDHDQGIASLYELVPVLSIPILILLGLSKCTRIATAEVLHLREHAFKAHAWNSTKTGADKSDPSYSMSGLEAVRGDGSG